MDHGDNRYAGSSVGLDAIIGCLTWLAATLLLVRPMIWLILGDCFFEEGCGVPEVLWLMVALAAAFVGGLAISLTLRAILYRLLRRLR